MFLNKKCCLALAVLTAIAHHAASGSKVSASALVERYQLPARALEPILQHLARAGFIHSVRGGSGGYEVIQPNTTTVANVVQSILPDALPTQPLPVFQPVLDSLVLPLEIGMLKQLQTVTIADLADKADAIGISKAMEPLLNYSI